jgi:hypothetical protein
MNTTPMAYPPSSPSFANISYSITNPMYTPSTAVQSVNRWSGRSSGAAAVTSKLEPQLAAIEAENQALRNKLTEIENQRASLTEQLQAATTANAALESQLTRIEEELVELTQKNDVLVAIEFPVPGSQASADRSAYYGGFDPNSSDFGEGQPNQLNKSSMLSVINSLHTTTPTPGDNSGANSFAAPLPFPPLMDKAVRQPLGESTPTEAPAAASDTPADLSNPVAAQPPSSFLVTQDPGYVLAYTSDYPSHYPVAASYAYSSVTPGYGGGLPYINPSNDPKGMWTKVPKSATTAKPRKPVSKAPVLGSRATSYF